MKEEGEEDKDKKKKHKAYAIALVLCGLSWLALPLIAWYVYKAMKIEKEEKEEDGKEE